jgi:ubiquinone/menaquinone biosynthesis C-methylase UbiE
MEPLAKDYRFSHVGEQKALAYAAQFDDARTVKYLHWQLEKLILTRILAQYGMRSMDLLDFACGTGRVISFLEDRFRNSTGVDISPNMLRLASQQCSKSTLICADVTQNDCLNNKKYDVITSFRFFLNAQQSLREEALAWVRSHLRENGLLICNFHFNSTCPSGLLARVRSWVGRGPLPSMVSVQGARALLSGAGFRVVSVVPYGYLPFSGQHVRPFLQCATAIEKVMMRTVPAVLARNFIITAQAVG